MTRLFASLLMSPRQAGLADALPDRKLMAASAFGALASFFAALVSSLARFFASAAASQDRGEIRRAIEKGRMGL